MGCTQYYTLKLSSYIQILRPKNLALIALSQTIFYYYLILPALNESTLLPQLDLVHFILFVLCTLSLAGAGYIINDISDINADEVNKPQLNFINQPSDLKNALKYYYAVVIFGFLIAIYLALHIHKFILLGMFPIATFLLYYYSKNLKSKIFVGNLIIALFCGFVTAILLISEPQLIDNYSSIPMIREVTNLIIAYSIFGFFINLLREICKDLEDQEGDRISNLQTMPLVKGINFSKNVFQTLLFFLIISIVIWVFYLNEGDFRSKSFFSIFIIAPLCILISRMIQAKEKLHFSKISSMLKMIMAAAIIYILLFKSSVSI